MDLKTATPSHAAAGINIELESPAKAYHSGYTTPLDSYHQRPVPLSNLDERLSKVDASCPPCQARLSVIPAADSPAAGTVANDGISTAADASAAADQGIQASTLHNLGRWIVKNQKFLACLWSIGASGWSDACLGALLPFIQIHYNIGYQTASILFLATCIGFFLATCSINYLTEKFGRGKVITLGAGVQVIGYAMMIAAPPFPALCVGWVIVAYGAATQLSQTNSYVATLPNPHQALGSLHGAYGLGGAASPLVATAFVTSGSKFNYFFAVSLSFAAMNVSILLLTFRLKRDEISPDEAEEGHQLVESTSDRQLNGQDTETRVENGTATQTAETREDNSISSRAKTATLKEVLVNKTVLTISFFLMCYCGAEVAIGGWIVTFLREDLGGSNAIGYAATGFWLGIAAGRVFLPRFSMLVGERRVVYLYLAISLCLEFVVWFSRNLYAAAICTAVIGFFIGPFFPNAITLGTKLLNKRLHLSAITIFACLGSCGNALFPFCTGMLASKFGIWVLQPVVVSLIGAMTALWSLLPRVQRRSD